MKAPFELEWTGAFPARCVRRRRPSTDDLPWGTLDLARYSPALLLQARRAWTEGVVSEYATALGLGRLASALLEARAPIDLTGMISDFILDEMVHVELNARMAMELGGAAPVAIDTADLGAGARNDDGDGDGDGDGDDAGDDDGGSGDDPVERAALLALRICCVGEAFSLPMLAAMARAARHPLAHALLGRIAREEAPHARGGADVVAWALPRLGDAARRRLAAAAVDEIAVLRGYWADLAPATAASGATTGATTRSGHPVEHVLELGWLEAGRYAALARGVAARAVIEPIARLGVPIDRVAAKAALG